MMRPAAALLLLAVAVSAPAFADSKPSCAALVTTAEVEKALGRKVREMEARTEDDGGSMCAWMKADDGKFFTAAVQFWTADVIKKGEANNTPEATFDAWVESAKAGGATKTEPLAGIGKRAVLMNPAPQSVALIQTKDGGVARIVANDLSAKQVTELARAVVTP